MGQEARGGGVCAHACGVRAARTSTHRTDLEVKSSRVAGESIQSVLLRDNSTWSIMIHLL